MWTSLRKKLEDNLPDGLKEFISFHMAAYTDGQMAIGKGNQWPTLTIVWCKKVVLRTYKCLDDTRGDRLDEQFKKKNMFYDTDHFFHAYDDYMSKKHEETAFVDDPYFRVFALLDRRTGRRTLQKYLDSGDYEKAKRDGLKELVDIYDIRFGAEGIGNNLRDDNGPAAASLSFHTWGIDRAKEKKEKKYAKGTDEAKDDLVKEECALPSPDWPKTPEEIDSLSEDRWPSYAGEMTEISRNAIRLYLPNCGRVALDFCLLECSEEDSFKDVFAPVDEEMSKACQHKWIANRFSDFPKKVKKRDCADALVYYTGCKGRFVIALFGSKGGDSFLTFVDEFTLTKTGDSILVVPLKAQGLELGKYKWLPSITPEEYNQVLADKKK